MGDHLKKNKKNGRRPQKKWEKMEDDQVQTSVQTLGLCQIVLVVIIDLFND